MAITQSDNQTELTEQPRITGRSILLGLLTGGVMAYSQNVLEIVLHAGSLVKSSFPVALILGFLVWIVINMIIARVAPKAVLSTMARADSSAAITCMPAPYKSAEK